MIRRSAARLRLSKVLPGASASASSLRSPPEVPAASRDPAVPPPAVKSEDRAYLEAVGKLQRRAYALDTVDAAAPDGVPSPDGPAVVTGPPPGAALGCHWDAPCRAASPDPATAQQRLERQNAVAPWEGHPDWPRSAFSAADPCGAAGVFEVPPPSKANGWLDRQAAYCRLCDEPVGNLSTHSAYWDHVNLAFLFHLYARFPRAWHPAAVNDSDYGRTVLEGSAGRRYHLEAITDGEHARRLERVAAVLRVVAAPAADSPLAGMLHRSLGGEWGDGMTGQGERMFRGTVAELCTLLLPPMSPQCHSRFQQKSWGRKNLEKLYDVLSLGALQQQLGAEALEDKNDKGAAMRQLVAELHLTHWVDGEGAVAPSPSECLDMEDEAAPPSADPVLRDVRDVLAAWLLRGLAAELVTANSHEYMARVDAAHAAHGYPHPSTLPAKFAYPEP